MINKLKIALVTNAMYVGGLENSILRLGKFLVKKGNNVEIITTVERGQWYSHALEMGLKIDHVEKSLISNPIIHSLRVGYRLLRGKYDVIFLFSDRDAQASLGMLSDKSVVIPMLRNDYEDIYKVGCSNSLAWNVAVGNSIKVTQTAKTRCSRPILYIPNGIEPPSELLRCNPPTPYKQLKLVFIGRLSAEKGVIFLPEILRNCLNKGIDAFLTIVGDGPDRNKLEQKVQDLSLCKNVNFHGAVPPDKIYPILMNSHILIFTSFVEGFPNVLLEAQVCGCVPVASLLDGITDTAVEHGVTGFLIKVGDIKGFVDSIEFLYKNPNVWSMMSSAGREKIRQEFTLELMGNQYLKIVYDALNGLYPLPRSRRLQSPIDFSLFTWRDFVPTWLKKIKRTIWKPYLQNGDIKK